MATEFVIRGIDCRLYLGSGTFASPSFSEIKNAGDVKIPSNPEMADITTRAGRGLKQEATALLGLQIECKLIKKEGDANWGTIKDAFMNGGQLLIAEASGGTLSGGAIVGDVDYVKMFANVAKFDETHENGQVVSAEVTFSPGEGDASGNVWAYVAASS